MNGVEHNPEARPTIPGPYVGLQGPRFHGCASFHEVFRNRISPDGSLISPACSLGQHSIRLVLSFTQVGR